MPSRSRCLQVLCVVALILIDHPPRSQAVSSSVDDPLRSERENSHPDFKISQPSTSDHTDIGILYGSFTLPLGILHGSVEEEIVQCDECVGCAGVTFHHFNNKTIVMVHNFVPGGVVSQYAKNRGNSDNHGDWWRTYRSQKKFIFHRGRLESDDDGTTSTELLLSLDEAKSRCQTDPSCVGFTFPIESTHLASPENVTFLSSIANINRGDADQWRSYISNDPGKASNISHTNIEIHEEELDRPWATQKCCTRKKPWPSLQELEIADQLERVACNISQADFRARYETARVPVALVGCDSEWPAAQRWTPPQLRQRFTNETTFVGKFHNKRVDMNNIESLGWIAGAMASGQDYYVFDNLLSNPAVFELLDDFVLEPGPIQNLYLAFDDFPPGYGPSRWFTFGGPGTGTWPHADPIAADAWNYLAYGYKWWVLYPFEEEDDLGRLFCEASCSAHLWNTAHWFATVGINAARNEYSGVSRKTPIHVLQKPGEVLYIPNGMIHAVMNLDHSIAVAAHFASTQNLENVWLTIVDLGTDKHWRKAYYGGILNKEQRKMARDALSQWPPAAGDMYFFDGPFLPPEKRLGGDIDEETVGRTRGEWEEGDEREGDDEEWGHEEDD